MPKPTLEQINTQLDLLIKTMESHAGAAEKRMQCIAFGIDPSVASYRLAETLIQYRKQERQLREMFREMFGEVEDD